MSRLYFTRIKLGTPPKEFLVMVDTGSSLLWITCKGYIPSSIFNMTLFDPSASSTCIIPEKHCLNTCTYKMVYGLNNTDLFTSGHMMRDTIHMDMVSDKNTTTTSAPVYFGCSTVRSGDLRENDMYFDGIMGLGNSETSIVSQLHAARVSPRVFSHCLGSNNGGKLVLGEIVVPGTVYTPMTRHRSQYKVELQNIAVNGAMLDIDSSVFSAGLGTFVDSGTSLAILTEEAYDPLITAIANSVQLKQVENDGSPCFVTNNSDAFPHLTLNFAEGASMELKPKDYLHPPDILHYQPDLLCIGWQKSKGVTVLGDMLLKDKNIVYDIANHRIGWRSYNCSSSINVTTSGSSRSVCCKLLLAVVLTFMLMIVGVADFS